ncbi:IclR family transcriptional regulator domain-containing protein [Streptomyces caniscabiei]|uniref:IclR family transcriptional regulator domain-containing protein n=1 Tax=Streptomyces caniscabiei TaxID=2746961 RepID=UPI0029C05C74|nr:IclR family transcriptional regulator C-terminal domain-containing protein [Streptomyces caniscabiei]
MGTPTCRPGVASCPGHQVDTGDQFGHRMLDLEGARSVRRGPGFALNDEELAPGLRSLAAPVRDRSGAVVAAVDVAVHLTVWNASVESVLSRLEAPLRRTATEISTRLGHRPHP